MTSSGTDAPVIAPFVRVADLDRMLAADARGDGDVVVIDSRWYLDGRSGSEAHAEGHIPGAVFIDLDVWLAGQPSPAAGRHPLPEPHVFARAMSESGIGDGSTVVAYDDAGGAIASRLVWMLRALGHEAAVLDGGVDAWQRAHPEVPLETGPVEVGAASFTERPWPNSLLATIDETQSAAADGSALVIDARAAARYRGETEPIDSRAGHIPGAVNLPSSSIMGAEGELLPVGELLERFAELGAAQKPVIGYCGSGITSCHTLLALEHAGFEPGRLYAGSWSQYSADLERPAATA